MYIALAIVINLNPITAHETIPSVYGSNARVHMHLCVLKFKDVFKWAVTHCVWWFQSCFSRMRSKDSRITLGVCG